MGEPRAITYKEVRDSAEGDLQAKDTWRKICDVAGSGHIPIGDSQEASIDITGLSDAKRGKIDKLVAGSKVEDEPEDENEMSLDELPSDEAPEEEKTSKKRGK